MIWLVWRRQRAALLVALGLVAAVAVAVVVVRLLLASGAARIGALECLDRRDDAECTNNPAFLQLDAPFSLVHRLTPFVLLVLPAAVGITAGAGLFAREIEQGTAVFALTQSVSRLRWWATGLLVAGVPAAVAVALLTPLATWALSLHQRGHNAPSGLAAGWFDITGLVPAAHTLLAFTLAAVAGMLLRTALGAVVLTAFVQLLLQLGLVGLRPHYAAPAELRRPLPRADDLSFLPGSAGLPEGAWYVDQGYLDAAGRVLPDSALRSAPCDGDFYDCLRAKGALQELTTYHDAAKYWPFQAIEAALLLAVVAALLGVGALSLRRIGWGRGPR